MSKKPKEKKPAGKSLAEQIVKKADARRREADKAAAVKAKEDAKKKAAAEKQKAEEAKAKAKADAEKVNAAHGLVITKAVAKGEALARKGFGADNLVTNLGTAIGKMVSSTVKVTSMGVQISKGHQLTEEEISTGIAGAGGILCETEDFRSTLKWVLGDFANAAPEDQRDRVVAQAVKEHGIVKHTVMQAMRVNAYFPFEERIKGCSQTHHMEIFNYRDGVKGKKKFNDLLEELREQGKKGDVMSCAALRERLQEIAGKKPKEKGKSGDNGEGDGTEKEDKKPLFFYIAHDGGSMKFSHGLNLEVCKAGEHLVIDVEDMTVLKEDGSLNFMARELEVEGQEAEEELEATLAPEPEQVKKPSKPEKKRKAKPATIPD